MLEAFKTWPSVIPEAERAALTARATDAYRQSVAPAFKKLHDFLTTRYLPACRETIGANALPNGAAMYAYNVRWHTTSARTPKEIHEIGLAEVKRIRAEMDAVMTASGFAGSYEEFKQFLRTSPQFFFKDASSLLTAYRDVAKRADPDWRTCSAACRRRRNGVKPVPDALAPSQTTAYYSPDPSSWTPRQHVREHLQLDSRPRWEMEALTMHEAVPGHHLQISLAQERQGLP